MKSEGNLRREFVRLMDEKLSEKGWSRADLARQMGVKPQYVTNYLNGRSAPGPKVITRFFGALGYQPRLTLEPRDDKQPLDKQAPSLRQRFRHGLQRALKAEGITQGELAKRMGVSRAFVSIHLTKDRNAGLGVVERFANAFGVDPHSFFEADLEPKD